ncbi:2c7082e8-02a3-4a3e-8bcb-06d113ba99b6 [Thermothielavioides terrestris]|uniref:2c7082e8-02a3-4a3e-8bcb-06d113ba99b6 n=1 Tax=Thermothielavioides terrestris TaxID=2587410 RepID=A0A3S5CXT8_9PEZI|nr:2c7082e8-02a3-4a3e-8bcb-06d113ba99b6 [Thermothielavioides terrestris]
MRRTFLRARPSPAVFRAFGDQQPRRTFATPPIKDDSPPSPIEPSKQQAHPIGPFYEAILRTPKPLPKEKPKDNPVTSQESPKPAPGEQTSKPAAEEKPASPAAEEKASEPAATEEKAAKSSSRRPRKTTTKAKSARARIIIGSRLAGPAERAERLADIRRRSRLVAGVLVPPRPEEPDNCCMSGCVNCVWERYREEMEDWAARSAEAERRLRAAEAGEAVGATEDSMEECGRAMDLGVHDETVDRGAASMDEDGGGSVGNWERSGVSGPWTDADKRFATKDFWDEELYKNLPVEIREFIKHEKRLKEKHRREGTVSW